jgi:hypothetical protein
MPAKATVARRMKEVNIMPVQVIAFKNPTQSFL